MFTWHNNQKQCIMLTERQIEPPLILIGGGVQPPFNILQLHQKKEVLWAKKWKKNMKPVNIVELNFMYLSRPKYGQLGKSVPGHLRTTGLCACVLNATKDTESTSALKWKMRQSSWISFFTQPGTKEKLTSFLGSASEDIDDNFQPPFPAPKKRVALHIQSHTFSNINNFVDLLVFHLI